MKKLMLVVVVIISLTGCGHLNKVTVPYTKAETKDIAALIEAGDQFNKNWPGISGYLDGILGSRKSQLPGEALSAWEDLDTLAGVTRENGILNIEVDEDPSINNYQKGYVAGSRARLLWPILLEGIKLIAPDVFEAIGGLL